MRTITPQYLQKKLQHKSQFNTLLLTLVTAIVLSACGVRGDLYQTPDQPAADQVTQGEKAANKRVEPSKNSDPQLKENTKEQ